MWNRRAAQYANHAVIDLCSCTREKKNGMAPGFDSGVLGLSGAPRNNVRQ